MNSKNNNDIHRTGSTAGKIFRNFSFLTMGKICGDAFTFVLFIVLSRKYGQDGIGCYSFAMALTGFFAALSEFGLYHYSIKEMSRFKRPLGEYYGKIFLTRLILSVTVFLLLTTILFFSTFPFTTKVIITLIGAYQIIYMLLDGFFAVFIAGEDMRIAGLLEFFLRLAIAAISMSVAMLGGNLALALIAYPLLTLILTAYTYKLVIREHGTMRLAPSWRSFKTIISGSSTYAVANILFILSARIDIILLDLFLGDAATGIYNAAYRMIFIFMVITHFASVSIFPLASRLYIESEKEFKKLYHNIMNIMMLLGIPASFCLWLVSPDIIEIFFGEQFIESIPILRILAALFFLTLLENITATFLMSREQEKDRTRGYWIVAVANLLGNIILIPLWGIKGAAVATLLSKIAQVIYYLHKLQLGMNSLVLGGKLLIGLVSCVSIYLPFLFAPKPSLGLFPVGLILWGLTLVCFKSTRENELRVLLMMLHSKKTNNH